MSEQNGAANNGNPGTQQPAGGGGGGAWYADEFKDLVTAKGWGDANGALKSYADLEKHLGAPADRLIRVPDAAKIDDTFRADVFKRIGYQPPAAPSKWEEYGIQAVEGSPPEYASHMAKVAHSLGITKAQMDGLVKAQNEFGGTWSKNQLDAETKQITDAIAAADKADADRFGPKAKEMQEGMLREAVRLGIKAEELPELEKDLAVSGRLGIFRTMLGDLAQMRAEGSMHNDGQRTSLTMTPEQAKSTLAQKRANPEWAAKAILRGTPEAMENLKLNWAMQGVVLDDETAKRLAAGLTEKPAA